jgi:hypothetical protein
MPLRYKAGRLTPLRYKAGRLTPLRLFRSASAISLCGPAVAHGSAVNEQGGKRTWKMTISRKL